MRTLSDLRRSFTLSPALRFSDRLLLVGTCRQDKYTVVPPHVDKSAR